MHTCYTSSAFEAVTPILTAWISICAVTSHINNDQGSSLNCCICIYPGICISIWYIIWRIHTTKAFIVFMYSTSECD